MQAPIHSGLLPYLLAPLPACLQLTSRGTDCTFGGCGPDHIPTDAQGCFSVSSPSLPLSLSATVLSLSSSSQLDSVLSNSDLVLPFPRPGIFSSPVAWPATVARVSLLLSLLGAGPFPSLETGTSILGTFFLVISVPSSSSVPAPHVGTRLLYVHFTRKGRATWTEIHRWLSYDYTRLFRC